MKFELSARQKGERRRGVRDRDVGCSGEQLERLLQWPNDGSRGGFGHHAYWTTQHRSIRRKAYN